MTKHPEPNGELVEQAGHIPNDMLYLSNLFVERAQDISSIDSKSRAENYADGKLVFYLTLAYSAPHREEYCFSFLIGQQMLKMGWIDKEIVDVVALKSESVAQVGEDADKVFPMFIFVGDLVDSPKGIIPTGVWSLGTNKVPLRGSEFLFQSVLPGHPFTWKFFSLPGVTVDTTKREPYARRAAPIMRDNCNYGLVERCTKSLDYLNAVKCHVNFKVFLAACDYVKQIRITVDSDRVGVGLEVPIDGNYQILKFAARTGDILL